MKAADARRLQARAMGEDTDLLPAVKERAKWYGWLLWHDHDSVKNKAGLPDCLMLRRGVMLVRELKSETGSVRPAQRLFLREFELVQEAAPGVVSVGVWRPRDLLDGTIDREMR